MKKFWNKETGATMGMLTVCATTALVAGTLFANLAFPYRGGETGMLVIYVAERLKERKIPSKAYFCYLLEQRGSGYLFLLMAGLTAAARAVALCGAVGMGFLAGTLGSMAILQYGVRGLLVFLAAGLPQGIFYIPSMVVLLTEIYRQDGKMWKKTKEAVREYFLVFLICLLGLLVGVLLEAFCNPGFLSWVFAKM